MPVSTSPASICPSSTLRVWKSNKHPTCQPPTRALGAIEAKKRTSQCRLTLPDLPPLILIAFQSLRSQRYANEFFIIASEDAAIREGGVGPDDGTACQRVGRCQDVRSADFLIFFGRQAGHDEVSLFVKQHVAIAALPHLY